MIEMAQEKCKGSKNEGEQWDVLRIYHMIYGECANRASKVRLKEPSQRVLLPLDMLAHFNVCLKISPIASHHAQALLQARRP
jgi:hypothetical protein